MSASTSLGCRLGGDAGCLNGGRRQLLPPETPHRPLLVFIAFAVAGLSLVIQGGSVGLLVSRLFPANESDETLRNRSAERERIEKLVGEVGARVVRSDGMEYKSYRIAVFAAQRHALLDARDDGIFGAEALAVALRDVDIDAELWSSPSNGGTLQCWPRSTMGRTFLTEQLTVASSAGRPLDTVLLLDGSADAVDLGTVGQYLVDLGVDADAAIVPRPWARLLGHEDDSTVLADIVQRDGNRIADLEIDCSIWQQSRRTHQRDARFAQAARRAQ